MDPSGLAWGFFLLGAWILLAAGAVGLFSGALGGGPEGPDFAGYVLLDSAAKLAAVGALSWPLFFRPPPQAAPAPLRRAVPAGALTGLAFLPVMLGTVQAEGLVFRWFGREPEPQILVQKAFSEGWGTFLAVAAAAVVAAPVFEEVLFRRFLYSGLRRFAAPGTAALISAFAFAIWHANLEAIPVTFLLGLVLADLRERTGGLAAPIAAHACYNAFQMAGVWMARSGG